MKKKIKIIFAIAFIATICVFTPARDNHIIDVGMENIEALASGEGTSTICGGYGTIDCRGVKCELIWIY